MKTRHEPKLMIFDVEHAIDAFCNGRHVRIAVGPYSTSDRALGAFLSKYPQVRLRAVADVPPEADHAGLYGAAAPEPIKVISGGFSGGGAAAIKPKQQGRN